jgi:cytosine/adenosine deaminase-related metal-dependent hydrolase
MKFIKANYIITMDKQNPLIENGIIVFDKYIIDIGTSKQILSKYKNIGSIIEADIIIPGLVNSHVHMEFSANTTSLCYGDFQDWLNSVIINREDIIGKLDNKLLQKTISSMIQTGTTSIGAISSYGFDLDELAKSSLNVVYFNELIGSKADMVDILYDDFLARFNGATSYNSDRFKSNIAIHSPYSVHPMLIQKVISLAKDNNLTISSHLLESKDEKKWLKNGSGKFAIFFKKFFNTNRPITNQKKFLNQLEQTKVIFTHLNYANNKTLNRLKQNSHSIVHCGVSNRLLGSKKLNIQKILNMNIPISIGTDGLSSNNSLNMFDELRALLFLHSTSDVIQLSKNLLNFATLMGANALNINSGQISIGKFADFLNIQLEINHAKQIELDIILHTKKPKDVFIRGEKQCI